jgi:uncharacterized delta-60 repeat protein
MVMSRTAAPFLALLALSCALLATSAPAAMAECSVCFDDTWGNAGTAIATSETDGQLSAQGAAVDSQGRLVVVGWQTGDKDTYIARFDTNGDLDTSFSTDGRLELDIAALGDVPYGGVAIGPADSIVVFGEADIAEAAPYQTYVAKLTEAGAMDNTFGGGDGIYLGNLSGGAGSSSATGGTVLSDGSVLVHSNYDRIARLTAAGALDTTWGGGDGLITLPDADYAESRFAADGTAIVTSRHSGLKLAVTRMLPTGSLDPDFGTNGTVQLYEDGMGEGAALLDDGGVLVAGELFDAMLNPESRNVWRLTSTGELNTDFAGDGNLEIALGTKTGDAFRSAVQLDTGTIVVAEWGYAGDTPNAWTLRGFAGDGTVEAGFGTNGEMALNAEEVLEDGKILVAGEGGTAYAVGTLIGETTTSIVSHRIVTAAGDTEAPTEPEGVGDGTAAPDRDSQAAAGASSLFWTASTDDTGVDSYDWCINNAADCSTPLRTGNTAETKATSEATPALADGFWYACVRARDAAGNLSDYSCSDGFRYDRPTVALKLSVSNRARTALTLSWSAITCQTGAPQYKLYRKVEGGSFRIRKTTPNRSYRDTGLTADTKYTYRVDAYCGADLDGRSANIPTRTRE